jgi:hypothetical protein
MVQTSLSILFLGKSNNVADDFVVGDEVWDMKDTVRPGTGNMPTAPAGWAGLQGEKLMTIKKSSGCARKLAGGVGAFILLAMLLPPAAKGDVTVERYIKSGGFGGVGASEGTSTDRISGLKKRSVSAMKMTGKIGGLLGKLGGDPGSDEIVLVDEDRVITLDHKKKTYTERAITLPQGENEEASRSDDDDGPAGGEEEGEQPNVRVVRNEITVEDTGKTKTIGDFDCTQYLVTWILETENLDTGDRAVSTMTSDLWNTPETGATKALRQEEGAFNEAFLIKMGLDMPPQKMKSFGLMAIAGMLGADRDEMEEKMKELEKKFSAIEGFTIASAVTWKTKSTAEQTAPEEEEEKIDISRGVGGLFSGLAKKAMKKKAEDKKAEDGTVIFSSYAEIRKIDTSGVGASEFEVPDGYSKQ